MKFYITGLYHTNELNDRTLPPIEVEANDRLEALARTGATVWTEEEWQSAPRMYGVSENEMQVKHAAPASFGIGAPAPCGKVAWSWTSIPSEVACLACRELAS